MKKIITLSVLALASFASQAELRINGFANLVGGLTSSDETLYGYDDKMSFSQESLFAIQISGDINDKMTATGQLVARGENDYKAEFEWAYITYSATDKLNISAGRLRLPLFNYSTSKDVGYSYHWLTTPNVVYNVPFNNLDGVKFEYSDYAGDWEYNLSTALGTYKGESLGAINEGKNTYLLSAEASYEWFKIRGVFGATKATLDLATSDSPSTLGFAAGLAAMRAAGFVELEDALQIRDDTGKFLGLSLQVDKFDWFVSGEITSVDVEDSFAAKDIAYYVTAGIRHEKWTPSLTYQKFKSDPEIKFQNLINQIATSGLPAANIAQLTGLAIGGQLAQDDEYNVWSATIRYDLDTNVALKADISKLSDDSGDVRDATLVRFAVNYVF
jgi:hypothetical protein